jgi:hypothetical protein
VFNILAGPTLREFALISPAEVIEGIDLRVSEVALISPDFKILAEPIEMELPEISQVEVNFATEPIERELLEISPACTILAVPIRRFEVGRMVPLTSKAYAGIVFPIPTLPEVANIVVLVDIIVPLISTTFEPVYSEGDVIIRFISKL